MAPDRGPADRVVVVGAASRDLTDHDPRGWRLGGGVTYGALTLARLGLPTTAIIGVDSIAQAASEVDLLRQGGVDVIPAPLEHGPVFVNRETAAGRVQTAADVSDPISMFTLPRALTQARAFLFAPVAAEIPAEWAGVTEGATMAVGWQGLLRTLVRGETVRRLAPAPHPLIARADLVGLSANDIDRATELASLQAMIGGDLLLTHGAGGGLLATKRRLHRYEAVRAVSETDPTGAGDVMLAALFAARLVCGEQPLGGRHLRFAAAAASLVIEQAGILGVPTLAAIRRRLSTSHAATQPA